MGLLSESDQYGELPGAKATPVDNIFRVTKKFWSYVKSLKTYGSGVGTLIVESQETSNAKDKATALSNQYSNVLTDKDTSNVPQMPLNQYS